MIAEPKLGPLGARETTRLPFTGGKKEWMESPRSYVKRRQVVRPSGVGGRERLPHADRVAVIADSPSSALWTVPLTVPLSRRSASRSRGVMDTQLQIDEGIDHRPVGALHDHGAGAQLLSDSAHANNDRLHPVGGSNSIHVRLQLRSRPSSTPALARHWAEPHPQKPCSVYCLTPKGPSLRRPPELAIPFG